MKERISKYLGLLIGSGVVYWLAGEDWESSRLCLTATIIWAFMMDQKHDTLTRRYLITDGQLVDTDKHLWDLQDTVDELRRELEEVKARLSGD